MIDAYIGLGSNLDEPIKQIGLAIEAFKAHKTMEFKSVSAVYLSKPMGPQDQPDYINAVVKISTELNAEQLLDELQAMENSQGRVRNRYWGERTLDLDILLYGNEVINTDRLSVPHSGISQRNFVLYPLNDLVGPDFEIPGLGKLSGLLKSCSNNGIERLSTA